MKIQLHGTEQTSAIPKLPATVESFSHKSCTDWNPVYNSWRLSHGRCPCLLESEYITHGDVVFVTYEVLSHGVESVAVEFVVTLDHFHEVDENASGHVDVLQDVVAQGGRAETVLVDGVAFVASWFDPPHFQHVDEVPEISVARL
jgi:hypothetical protein